MYWNSLILLNNLRHRLYISVLYILDIGSCLFYIPIYSITEDKELCSKDFVCWFLIKLNNGKTFLAKWRYGSELNFLSYNYMIKNILLHLKTLLIIIFWVFVTTLKSFPNIFPKYTETFLNIFSLHKETFLQF